jgi:hypothetical protein
LHCSNPEHKVRVALPIGAVCSCRRGYRVGGSVGKLPGSGAAGLTAKLVPRRHPEPRAMALAAPLLLTGLQRGVGQPVSPCSGGVRRDLGNGAAMAAFGESCRHR